MREESLPDQMQSQLRAPQQLRVPQEQQGRMLQEPRQRARQVQLREHWNHRQ